jgi:hypothetical protein
MRLVCLFVIREAQIDEAKYFSDRRRADKVYNPDIVSKSEKLYKKPGYTTERHLADFISRLVRQLLWRTARIFPRLG